MPEAPKPTSEPTDSKKQPEVKEPVKETPKEEPKTSPEADSEQLLAAKDAEIKRIREEKENYRKMALKYKKDSKSQSAKDDDEDDKIDADSIRDIATQAAREALLNSQEFQAQREKDELITKIARENKELKHALANKVPTSSPASGTNQDKKMIEVTADNYFSEAQIQELRRRHAILAANGVKITEAEFIANAKKNIVGEK